MDREEFDQWAEERRRRRADRERRREERRRERGEADGPGERKEKILHTRISESLDDALRRVATEMRVPVSGLVRNVLEDVFDVVETVTENVEDLVDDVMEEAGRVRGRLGHRRRRHRHRHRARRRHRAGAWADDAGSWTDWEERGDPIDIEVRAEATADAESEVESAPEAEPAAAAEEEERERPAFEDVIGWQPLLLNADQQCAECGRDLTRGDQAFMGLGTTGAPRLYLCRSCLEARG